MTAGCGTNHSIDFVSDSELIDLPAITFGNFNRHCPIIKECPENLSRKFEIYIEEGKKYFQFPQYYNCLVALCILFYDDENYNLKDLLNVRTAFIEANHLIRTVFEDFEDFDKSTLYKLLSTLSKMSCTFMQSNVDDLLIKPKKHEEENTEAECYVNKNGKRMQIKPLNFSSKIATVGNKQFQAATTLVTRFGFINTLASQELIKAGFEKFEKVHGSVTSGYVLRTIIGKYLCHSLCFSSSKSRIFLMNLLLIDVASGKIRPQDIPKRYVPIALNLFIERLRRGLSIHSEFSDKLSDYDRSLLWNKNYLLAGALSYVKVFYHPTVGLVSYFNFTF